MIDITGWNPSDAERREIAEFITGLMARGEFQLEQAIAAKYLDKKPVIRKGRLKFTIGAQRSGKSTYCTRWSQYLEDWTPLEPIFPRAIVCSDDIRLALHGERYNRDAESAVWMINGYMTKALITRGVDVIVDGTNTTQESIKRILRIDDSATYKVFHVDKEELYRRAVSSDQRDLIDYGVIDRCHGQLEELLLNGLKETVEEIRDEVRQRYAVDPPRTQPK